jgi:hypothetical protein
MSIAHLLAGAASFAALSGGLIGGSYLNAVVWAVSFFVLVFLYAALLGAAFPMGIAHLIGASLLGLLGHAIQRGLYRGRVGQIAWGIVTVLVAGFIAIGAIIALLSMKGREVVGPHGLFEAIALHQEQGLDHARAMMRGDAESPKFHQWRSLVDSGLRTTADTFFASPIRYAGSIGGYVTGNDPDGNVVYRLGKEIEVTLSAEFPGDPARRFEFSHMLLQGFTTTTWKASSR